MDLWKEKFYFQIRVSAPPTLRDRCEFRVVIKIKKGGYDEKDYDFNSSIFNTGKSA